MKIAIMFAGFCLAATASTPETSPLFKRHVDRSSGVVSYVLEPGRFAHNQQSIYFTAKSMTDDGRFLVFDVSDDEFAVRDGKHVKVKKQKAVIDFMRDKVILLLGIGGQIPFVDVHLSLPKLAKGSTTVLLNHL